MPILRSIAACIVAIAACGAAHAQYRPVAAQDPFFLNETGIRDTNNRDVASKTLASQTINTGIRNLVMIYAGQSNAQHTTTTKYIPTNASSIDNFNIDDGAIYKAVEPLNGCGANFNNSVWVGHHPATILADALITAGKFDRIIIVPIALGGSTIADWTTGALGNRIPVTMLRLAQRGIVAGTNVTFILIWAQGESDNQNGTSQATYVAGFNTLVANAVAAGFPGTGRVFVAKETYNLGTTSSAIQSAQTAASPSGVINNAASPPIYLGANADALVGSICNGSNACRQGDNTHFTNDGQVANATDATNGWQQALHASGAPF